MSWSLNASGTRVAVARLLADAKVHGGGPEEQACFDKARQTLLDYAAQAYAAPEPAKCATIISVSASGHGTQVSGISCSYSLAWLE